MNPRESRVQSIRDQLAALQAELMHLSEIDEQSNTSRANELRSERVVHNPGVRASGNQGGVSGQERCIRTGPDMVNTPKPVDISAIIRRWNIKFNGETGSSVEQFLTQIEKRNELTGLSDQQLLSAIPLMVEGVAPVSYTHLTLPTIYSV